MSSYCANSIFEYGMDVAKYNVIANVVKFMMKEVVLVHFWMLADYALTFVSNSKSYLEKICIFFVQSEYNFGLGPKLQPLKNS